MFKHLLVPLDGSSLAETALPVAMGLAERFDSEIMLLRVIRPPYIVSSVGGAAYAEMLAELRDQASEEARVYLREMGSTLRQKGYNIRTHVAEGENAAEIILDVVAGFGIDTIVMSTHGRGGVSRWVFGSIADKVLQQANVPVLLIRSSEEGIHWEQPGTFHAAL